MIRAFLAIALLTAAQSPPPKEKPKFAPFKVVITAKTVGVPEREKQAFESSVKQLKGYANLLHRRPTGSDDYERWTFELPGEKKFDPTRLWQTFINIKCKSYQLTMTGSLTQEEKTNKLFITSYPGNSKVKLMNPSKNRFDDPDKKVEDRLGQITQEFEKGQLHFEVTGEIFSHGGTLSIILESFQRAPPPPEKPKEEKK